MAELLLGAVHTELVGDHGRERAAEQVRRHLVGVDAAAVQDALDFVPERAQDASDVAGSEPAAMAVGEDGRRGVSVVHVRAQRVGSRRREHEIALLALRLGVVLPDGLALGSVDERGADVQGGRARVERDIAGAQSEQLADADAQAEHDVDHVGDARVRLRAGLVAQQPPLAEGVSQGERLHRGERVGSVDLDARLDRTGDGVGGGDADADGLVEHGSQRRARTAGSAGVGLCEVEDASIDSLAIHLADAKQSEELECDGGVVAVVVDRAGGVAP